MTVYLIGLLVFSSMAAGATLGFGLAAIFVVGGRDDRMAGASEFDTSISEWGKIGERRSGGDL